MKKTTWKAKAFRKIDGEEYCIFKSRTVEGLQKNINIWWNDIAKEYGAELASKTINELRIEIAE